MRFYGAIEKAVQFNSYKCLFNILLSEHRWLRGAEILGVQPWVKRECLQLSIFGLPQPQWIMHVSKSYTGLYCSL